jgi:type IX secretion system PorP/SprF family membrane protein
LRYRVLIIISGILLSSSTLLSQKVQFSQFYAAPLVLSPSYTGLTDGSRVVLNYRDQWPNIPGTFTTYAFSFDHYFDRLKSGFGLSIVRDEAGSGNLSLTDIGLLYSYDITINRDWRVRPGMRFKHGQRGIEIAKLIFGDQLLMEGDPTPSSVESDNFLPKKGYLDVDASVIAYHKYHWAGITVANLLRPNQSFIVGYESRVPIKLTLFGGTRLPIKGDKRRRHEITESVTFTGLYQIQDMHDQIDLGAYWVKEPFTLGLWFRGIPGIGAQKGYEALDAVVVLFGFQIMDLRFGYSFDYTLSKLNQSATGGAHEISLVYEFNKNLDIKRKRRSIVVPCPKF